MARPGRDQALAEPGLIAGGHLSEEQEWEETMNNDLVELTRLNHDYVASVQNSDVKRFDEILAADFYCSNPDKSLVDRAAFLEQTARPVAIRNLRAEDVKIRILGDFAIIHRDQLHHAGRPAGPRPLYRLLGKAERQVAGGVGACDKVAKPTTVMPRFRRGIQYAVFPIGVHNFGRGVLDRPVKPGDDELNHASNMITLRSVLPAFMLAKPSLISDSFSLAEIQSSRCSLPRM